MFRKSLTVVDEIPYEGPIKENEMFFISSNNVSYLTHTIHKYPAKYIPQIPRWAISKYLKSKNNWILDPFCGSGTTMVEGMILGQNSIGVDIDPLATLISKVKTTPIPSSELEEIIKELNQNIDSNGEGLFKPKITNLNHWFTQGAINQLGIIRDNIEEYKSNKDIYDFLMVTFSSIIRKASNADDQSQKTYVSHTNKKEPKPAIPLFFDNLEKYSKRIGELFNLVNRNNVSMNFNYDSRNIDYLWKKEKLNKIDLAITSPPYIKAIDYIYNQMAEYFWIGDIFSLESQQKQNLYKKNYIGTKQLNVSEYREIPRTGDRLIDELVKKIENKNKKYAYIVSKFFIDMEINLIEMKKILEKDAHYIIVIGNNKVCGYDIPSNKLLIRLGEKAGFKFVNCFGYEIRNRYMRFPRNGRGGIIKEDWIIDLKN